MTISKAKHIQQQLFVIIKTQTNKYKHLKSKDIPEEDVVDASEALEPGGREEEVTAPSQGLDTSQWIVIIYNNN